MISWWVILAVSMTYVGVLFAIAHWGNSSNARRVTRKFRPLIYSLALGVYCTSWTFYGAVGSAARTGWGYLPIYLGPILVFVFGFGLIRRIVNIAQTQNLTSIADFIAARYGKGRALAVLVTVMAVAGSVPYIALQLKAVASGFEIVARQSSDGFFPGDTALPIAALLTLFAIIFGTRQIDASEHHRGMMLAIAFESVVKLLAFAAIGVLSILWLREDSAAMVPVAGSGELFSFQSLPDTFVTQTLLAAAAAFCLPRQFHVAAVEAESMSDLAPARWIFPLYLLCFCVFVVPITYAGLTLLPGGNVAGDAFVLALPMSRGNDLLTTLAFLGGFSAATGMVIVASLTLSTMVSNEIVMPSLFSIKRLGMEGQRDYSALLLQIRRLAIVGIVGAAYIYHQLVEETAVLASIGLLSFAAAAQFAPLILIGMLWPQANRRGAIAGLSVGFILWLYTLFLPSMAGFGEGSVGAAGAGPFGQSWLSPQALFLDLNLSPLTHGVLLSLTANAAVLWLVSYFSKRTMSERIAAGTFVQRTPANENISSRRMPEIVNADLVQLAERILGVDHTRRALNEFARSNNIALDPQLPADLKLVRFTERLLAGAVGTSSARVIMTAALRRTGMGIGDVVLLLDETSQAIRFNRQLLEATLANMSQGVSVIDASQRLIGWNASYLRVMGYASDLVHVGKPIIELFEYNARRGHFRGKDPAGEIRKRMKHLREGTAYRYESEFPNGRVIEIRGQSMPDGGYVTTYSDISEAKATESALRDSEKRVRGYTDNLPVMISYLDADCRLRFANIAYARYVGLPIEQIVGRDLADVLPSDALMSRRRYLDAAYGGARQQFEFEEIDANGQQRYFLANYVPDIGERGRVIGLYATFQDITVRRKAELALGEAKGNLERRVEERTTELSAALGDLQMAQNAAERAHASKTHFFAAAAHDLLQPINAAKLFSALLLDSRSELPAEQQKLVAHVESSLISVEELLNSLLEISQLDAGTHTPRIAPVELQVLFDTLEEQFAESCRERGLRLRFVPTRSWTRSDPQLLRRILQNLVGNAQRYTEAGGIAVGVRRRGDHYALCVYDTGVGIAFEDQERIFEEFERLHNGKLDVERGVGLGLAIVQRIARLLDHDVTMRSQPDQGSCFEVRVPIVAGAQAAHAIADTPPASRLAKTLAPNVVLCVDNDLHILEGMSGLLKRWGLKPYCLNSFEGTHDMLAQIRAQTGGLPRLLLLDYHLDDGHTGLDVAKLVQAITGTHIPAAVLTANRDQDLRERLLEVGYRILYKPVRPAALRALISSMTAAAQVAQDTDSSD